MLTALGEASELYALQEILFREGYKRMPDGWSWEMWTSAILNWNHYVTLADGQPTNR